MTHLTTAERHGTELRDTVPYVLPFFCFIILLAIQKIVPIPSALRFFMIAGVILSVSRQAIPARITSPSLSVLLGVAVFAIWVGPDLLFPHYRGFWLFTNGVTGTAVSTLPVAQRSNVGFLIFRVLESVVTIPILEELFWRGWLMRWLIARDFTRLPLGAYQAAAFWLVAALFASEHGAFWEVGLAAGVIYNWWLVRTRSLLDCILAHAVTNACLAAYVIGWNQWQYWL